MEQLTGAELTIRLLEEYGIETIAGIPGGANLPLYDALSRSSRIRHVLARHEQGAGFIAQGMARSSGKPAVCFATSGPGATNIVTALADANLDSIPVICITGQVPLSMIGTDAFQEVDVYGLTIPITKHNFLVRSAQDLLRIIPEAFHIATTGRPGPVLIDIPKDVQLDIVDIEELPIPASAVVSVVHSQDDLTLAAAMINNAKRPVFYVGGGIVHSDAGAVARFFAEKNSLPTTMTLMGLGVIPPEHDLFMGMLGMHAARSTNMMLDECDLLIAAGVRFDDRATGKIGEFCPEARIIHIDIDPCEICKLKEAHVGLVGDIRDTLDRLLPLVESRARSSWNQHIQLLRARHPFFCSENFDFSSPYGIIMRIAEIVGEDAIVATDVGKHQMWTAQVYPFNRTRRFLTSGGLGTMGFGLPTAIGAALENPDKTVVCITGDGSIMMNIQELATAVEHDVNVKVIVLNNQSLGLVRQQQKLFYNEHIFASEYEHQVDLATIAKGFGMKSFDARDTLVLDELLTVALQTPGPSLINIPISIDEEVYPIVPPGAANSVMIGGNYECA
ncbi:acetolactate synthase large subunit [Desulfogranum marinum]|uniref:acetolactate synthase large subunit n=1 Tax=Desulfogranum marinum TaxID=453220 RepID=UPI001966BFF5|nr:acetolactate synthase large subunit [Desulfogranum marinum]MBM9512492.1 acetolactate synthase large subunit [Desulfogranum marinum]